MKEYFDKKRFVMSVVVVGIGAILVLAWFIFAGKVTVRNPEVNREAPVLSAPKEAPPPIQEAPKPKA